MVCIPYVKVDKEEVLIEEAEIGNYDLVQGLLLLKSLNEGRERWLR